MELAEYNLIVTAKKCPYCGSTPELVDSKEIYGRSYGYAYLCRPCDAYVGCHKGTTEPLGRLADARLRDLKKRAHFLFDRLWKESKRTTRSKAYQSLADHLNIPAKYCHIGMFNPEQCFRTMDFATRDLEKRGKL